MDTREMAAILPQLDPAFERGAWLLHCGSEYLNDAMLKFVSLSAPDCIACTCTVMDIFAGKTLRYERSKGQRGFCMWFGKHPLSLGSEVAWAAVIHEAGHYLNDRHPSRDEPDEGKAIADWWGTWKAEDNSHGDNWRRACAHLVFRAMRLGLKVNSTALFEQFGGIEFMTGLRAELVSRADEPIERILFGPPSANGSQLEPATRSGTPRKPQKWPKTAWLGEPVLMHRDGSIEVLPDLSGKGGERFPSIEAFRARNRKRSQVA